MEVFLMKLGLQLAKALLQVTDEVLLDGMLDAGKDQVKAKIGRDIDEIKIARKVQNALNIAKQALNYDDDYPLRKAAGKLQGNYKALNELCQTVIVIAALMSSETDDKHISDALLIQLDLASTKRAEFARFLWALRTALYEDALKDEDFIDLVDRAKEQEGRDKLSAFLLKMSGAITDSSTGSALRTIVVPPEKRELERAYLERMLTSALRHVPLASRHKNETLRMEMKNVYINLYTTDRDNPDPSERSRLRKGNVDSEMAMTREQTPPWSALKSLLTHKHLVLLGHPGSGKTTFSDFLTLCLAGARYKQDPQAPNPLIPPASEWLLNLNVDDIHRDKDVPLPFRFRLRDFSAALKDEPLDIQGNYKHVREFIEKRLEVENGKDFITHAFRCMIKGEALLIFDGLDEVGDPKRRTQIAQAIADFAEQRCARSRILVTCRVRQYPLERYDRSFSECGWTLPLFHHTVLLDFNDDQIEEFVRGWYQELARTKAVLDDAPEKLAESLISEIKRQERFRDIAGRPILLTQQAIVHQTDGRLPRTRGKLYERCAGLLLWDWEYQRAMGDKEKMLVEKYVRDVLKLPKLTKESLQLALDHAVFDAHRAQGDASDGPANIPEERLVEYIVEEIGYAYPELNDITAEANAKHFLREYLAEHNGLIVPAEGDNSYQTPHRSFQEFMAARWLVQDDEYDTLIVDLVESNFTLWREVFLLSLGQTTEANKVRAVQEMYESSLEPIIDPAAWERAILAGQAMAELGLSEFRRSRRRRGEKVIENLRSRLQHIIQDTDPQGKAYSPAVIPVATRYQAGEMLDSLEWLPKDLNDWVEIPYNNGKFYIAKYPVTNHQYAQFVNDGGYNDPTWWGGDDSEAWQWRETKHDVDWRGKDPITEPEFWNGVRFGKNRRGYPVVGVSWYEATAYCRWKTVQLTMEGDPLKVWVRKEDKPKDDVPIPWDQWRVRLPVEDEWVAAAGGDENYRYPWGEWDDSKANTSESSLGGTSPVGMYPAGQSLHGVMDMAGNVWEWMQNDYVEDSPYPALRGGSWDFDNLRARVAYRSWSDRNSSNNFGGFRLVLSPNSSGC